jgi:hypothetical protein
MPTLSANRQRYQAEGSAAVFNFTRLLSASSGSCALGGNAVGYLRGYYLGPQTGVVVLAGAACYPRAFLRFSLAAGGFAVAGLSAGCHRGYILASGVQSLSSSWIPTPLLLSARLSAHLAPFFATWSETPLQRALRLDLSRGDLFCSTFGTGFQLAPAAPASGQPRPLSANPYGGSDDTGGSFVRPQYVKYNSVGKARDFGLVSNLFSVAEGELGGQAGSNTAFFAVETDGPAQLRIQNNSSAPFISRYISLGVLDADRKPIPLTPEGFAFRNDNIATASNESAESLPAGTYYFTISSNQWQALPFSVSIQVIRFKPLLGAAGGTFSPYGRFANAKFFGTATLNGLLVASLPPNNKLDRLTAAATLTAVPRLSLAIMRGAAGGAMSPYGRLKQTHRIVGKITGTCAAVATLSSAPPYGGGY